eukprot:TRINITY_DN7798_c0_g5_i1.p1 TRINITY_DN7798_c0_g5~~TRINITY_DN7798_c0_g5_i1.p1  ORF type:complete len:718 (-),score=42.72 TRINITY_DN7798_c0_g5_i1:148-2301(-)
MSASKQDVVLLLGAEAWLSAMGWVACIEYYQSFYWHMLDPALLGVDIQSLVTYFVVMILVPLFLDIPCISKKVIYNSERYRIAIAASIGIALMCGFLTENERVRSTGFLVAVFLVTFRLALVGSLPAATLEDPITERELAPWGATLGLLFVLARRLAVPPLLEMGESLVELAIVGIVSLLSLVYKAHVLSGETFACAESETESESDDESNDDGEALGYSTQSTKGVPVCCESLGAGAAVACVLVFTIWLLDAPWVVSHFVGLTGFTYDLLFILAFAAGICQTLIPPSTQTVFRAASLFLIELFLGCVLLNLHGTVGFVGGCLLALGAPGVCLLALQQASESIREHAIGRTMSCGGLTAFILVFAYMGTLTNSTPLFSSFLWPKFWLFTIVLCVCLALAFFLAIAMKNADIGSSAMSFRKATLAWVGIVAVVNAATAVFIVRSFSYIGPQNPGRGLVIGTYNVMQGYNCHGTPNFQCVAKLLDSYSPNIVGLQESDAVHFVSANHNIVSYLAGVLGLYDSVGPAGYEASVGVSILSKYELRNKSTHIMPTSPTGALNRFLTQATITVNGTNVVFISVHTEWFGDPAVQVAFIAEHISSIEGPLIVVGDFNMDISGQNEATIASNITTNGFQPLLDLEKFGLRSATPLSAPGCKLVSRGGYTYCPSDYTTVDLGQHASPGYQLDYIWYRDLWMVGEVTVAPESIGCSDHLYVQATFLIP